MNTSIKKALSILLALAISAGAALVFASCDSASIEDFDKDNYYNDNEFNGNGGEFDDEHNENASNNPEGDNGENQPPEDTETYYIDANGNGILDIYEQDTDYNGGNDSNPEGGEDNGNGGENEGGDNDYNAEDEYVIEFDLWFELNSDGESWALKKVRNIEAEQVIIPSTYEGLPVTKILGSAFMGRFVKEVTLPDSILEIEYHAFEWCDSLEKVNIPNNVSVLRVNTFYNCFNIKYLTLGNSLVTIEPNSLPSTYSLVTNELNGNYYLGTDSNPYFYLTSGTLENLHPDTKILGFVGQSSTQAYNIPEGIISINEGMFRNRLDMTSASIPSTLKNIPTEAFADCAYLASLSISEGVETLGKSSFSECDDLASVQLPQSLTLIDDYAFYKCNGLKDIYFAGTQAEWNAIEKGNAWDHSLVDARWGTYAPRTYTVHCSDGDIAVGGN